MKERLTKYSAVVFHLLMTLAFTAGAFGFTAMGNIGAVFAWVFVASVVLCFFFVESGNLFKATNNKPAVRFLFWCSIFAAAASGWVFTALFMIAGYILMWAKREVYLEEIKQTGGVPKSEIPTGEHLYRPSTQAERLTIALRELKELRDDHKRERTTH